MAFNVGNLTYSTLVAFDVDFGRVMGYTTGDNMATVDSGTYFNTADACKSLRKADWLKVTASDGKAIYMVISSTPTTPEVVLDKQAAVSSF
jgi:hypothetical protein